jgi:hypothetical protein
VRLITGSKFSETWSLLTNSGAWHGSSRMDT